MMSWIDEEVAESQFADVRLSKRFKLLIERLAEGIGETIPMACQDWANTKAAYRFLSNDRVTEEEILAGHFQSTRDRFIATEGTVLILHDTTAFSFQREDREPIGATFQVNSGKDKDGRIRQHTVCGILMHSSLVVTSDGLPLGLAAIKFWTRKKVQGNQCAEKEGQPNSCTYRSKGKRAVD
jgi:Transposase DNA-binding